MNKIDEFNTDVTTLTSESLRDSIQHAYNMGYAKGITENIEQWEKVLCDQFNTVADAVIRVYKDSILSSFKITNVYYNIDSVNRDVSILLVLPEAEFEQQFQLLHNHNVIYQKIIGAFSKSYIDIKCMPDCDIEADNITFDYKNTL